MSKLVCEHTHTHNYSLQYIHKVYNHYCTYLFRSTNTTDNPQTMTETLFCNVFQYSGIESFTIPDVCVPDSL